MAHWDIGAAAASFLRLDHIPVVPIRSQLFVWQFETVGSLAGRRPHALAAEMDNLNKDRTAISAETVRRLHSYRLHLGVSFQRNSGAVVIQTLGYPWLSPNDRFHEFVGKAPPRKNVGGRGK